jgi:hypothetical protein
VGSTGQPGVSDWVYDPGSFMVQNSNGLFGEDALRLGEYSKNSRIFDCPSMRFLATKAVGGLTRNPKPYLTKYKRQNTESDEKNTSYTVVAGSSGR